MASKAARRTIMAAPIAKRMPNEAAHRAWGRKFALMERASIWPHSPLVPVAS